MGRQDATSCFDAFSRLAAYRISGATRRRGMLLVAPNGNRKTWNFWDSETDDVPFGTEVLEDVSKNYPIDKERIYVSGYSFGSAMAWRYV